MGAMECFSFLLVVMVLSMTHSLAHQNEKWWSETIPYKMGMERMTKLHFYFHDNITGDYPTAFKIAEAPGSNISATRFGELYMADDPLTEGPDPNSRLVGRAQGFYGLSGMNELSLIMGVSLVFTGNKKFNGSTISVFTRNPITHKEREFTIVGGTGYFRFAHGFINAKTYRSGNKNAIVEYNCAAMKFFSFLAVAMVLSMSNSQAHQEGNWGDKTVPYAMGPEKMTKLRFYFHDIVVGDNPTAIRIAEAPGTNSSPTFFGALVMIDDPLTEGPDINSRLVGRAQGLYGLSGQNEISLFMGMSLVFTANGKFNGSTISVVSRNPVTHTEREFAIVGGTGYFQFARGFISAKTYNGTGPNPIVEYNCTIVHPRKMPFY
ncbi:hypothetical protein MKX03_017617 [Papaver bracteatum]|nr:hypothetical protein MKX03_017617 [Papaver bracteatum]